MARILIIDDEPAIAMVLEAALGDEGHDVITASDGLAGIERLRQGQTPDVVLVDLYMPRMSGRDLVVAMRADPALREIPVVLVTGAVPRPEDYPPEGAYQALITKPFDVADVIEKVEGRLAKPARDH